MPKSGDIEQVLHLPRGKEAAYLLNLWQWLREGGGLPAKSCMCHCKVVMALWRLLLGRSPYAAAFVKIDDDTWVVNSSMLMLTVASSLRPKSCPEGEGRLYGAASTRVILARISGV